jgi:phosphatidylserine/phosphatidylglycerophosphate/cardiolipin synthase-like enzyme
MTITPLLTPDPGDYTDAVGALIASATTSLYLQFQYIEPPKTHSADTQPFAQLIAAVADRQKAGVDVKIIMSEFETAGYLEQLQAIGIDVVHNVKIQNNVHNKGIIIDGHTVLVSSQNWSTAGTLHNRDAGVTIANPQAAQYFQQIFLHDWTHLATQKTHDD